MPTFARPVGYSGARARLTYPSGYNNTVYAYLVGGGGGGGGQNQDPGGNGAGGTGVFKTFTVSAGDSIEISVGGGGGPGATEARGSGGGYAGQSLDLSTVTGTVNLLSGSIVRSTNRAYCSFLNTYGVWNADIYSSTFDQTVNVEFPASPSGYRVQISADNYGLIQIDGQYIIEIGTYTEVNEIIVPQSQISPGIHSVRFYGYNSDGPGSIGGLISVPGECYCGGVGGIAGPFGASGAGGGGGGATVLRVNGNIIAIASGGGGGGGGGRYGTGGAVNFGNAPGPNGTSPTAPNGQDGGAGGGGLGGDGGGGGGGGGGLLGGNGGYWGGGPAGIADYTAEGGGNGTSLGDTIYLPNGREPGITWLGGGYGGYGYGQGTYSVYDSTSGEYFTVYPYQPGRAGGAYFEFQTDAIFVNQSGIWRAVQGTWVNLSGTWYKAKGTWIKTGGTWQSTIGTEVPYFQNINGLFGVNSRLGPQYNPPPMGGPPMGGMGDMF